jgi:hypothetical protein
MKIKQAGTGSCPSLRGKNNWLGISSQLFFMIRSVAPYVWA